MLAGLVLAAAGGRETAEGQTSPPARVPEERRQSPAAPVHLATADLLRKAELAAAKAEPSRKEYTEKSIRRSITALRESAQLFQSAGESVRSARAYLEVGNRLVTISRFEAAVGTYRLAFNLGNRDAEVRCLATAEIARTYADFGRSLEAHKYLKQTEKQCKRITGKAVRAEQLEACGEALFWIGDYQEAAQNLQLALELYRELKDQEGQATALLMLAYATNSRSALDAQQYAEQAMVLWSALGHMYGQARTRLAKAYFANNSGRFSLAQCECRNALSTLRRVGDKDNAAVAFVILGNADLEMRDLDSSLNDYQKARSAFAAVHDLSGEIEAISGLIKVLNAMDRRGDALELYRRKIWLAKTARMPALIASTYADIADVYESRHQYKQAEAWFRQARAQYRDIENMYGESDMLLRLARIKVETRAPTEAISLLDQARKLKESTIEASKLARIQYELAYVYRHLGRLDEARESIEQAVAIIESERQQISRVDSRAFYFAFVHEYYALYIEVLMLLERKRPGEGYEQRALEASEKSKVRSLLDLLSSAPDTSPCGDSVGPTMYGKPTSIASMSEDTFGGYTQDEFNIKDVQGSLGEDDVVLEYSLGEGESYLWIIDRSNVASYSLPSSDQIKKFAKAFRNSLIPLEPGNSESASDYQRRTNAATKAYRVHARHLSQVLLGRAVLPAGKRLLIVPDGDLQYIPFAALPSPRNESSGENLIEQHEVIVLPSVSALRAMRLAASKRAPPTLGVAVFANPIFETRERSTEGKESSQPFSGSVHKPLTRALRENQRWMHIPSLPGSEREAQDIQRIFGREEVFVALGLDATRTLALSGRLAPYRILHFATHGIIDTRHPELSGLILSLVDLHGKPQDGYLRLADIYNLRLSADLVVLSSCDSALGKALGAEGTIGLPRGFLHAGARSVIASLWKVDDEATSLLMKGLYTRIQRGESPSTALRGAQLDLSREERFSKPTSWAAFVFEGDYR